MDGLTSRSKVWGDRYNATAELMDAASIWPADALQSAAHVIADVRDAEEAAMLERIVMGCHRYSIAAQRPARPVCCFDQIALPALTWLTAVSETRCFEKH